MFPPTDTEDQWNDEIEAKIKMASKVYVGTSGDVDLLHKYF